MFVWWEEPRARVFCLQTFRLINRGASAPHNIGDYPVIQVNVTDTFGGKANYCWVRRYEINSKEPISDRKIVREAKRLAGWTGMRCKTNNYGDMIELRPVGACMCMVMFITWRDGGHY